MILLVFVTEQNDALLFFMCIFISMHLKGNITN